MTTPSATDEPTVVACPECGGEVRVWWTKADYRGALSVRYQAISHGPRPCQWFRDKEDLEAFSELVPPPNDAAPEKV